MFRLVRVNYGSGGRWAVSCTSYVPVPKTRQAFPGTCTHLQMHKHGYRSNEAPHIQPPPNLMCFHLTLLIHCTHAYTHMGAHVQVYEQTQVNIRFIQACRKTDTQTHPHTHIWCAVSTFPIREELQHAPKPQHRVFSGTENTSSINWIFAIRH